MSGEVAFGAEISLDRRRCAIVAAGREKDGTRVLVDLAWYDHPRGAAARLDELNGRHEPVAIVIDGASQSATLLRPLADLGITPLVPTARDVAVAHGNFMDLVNGGGLAHLDQPPLTAAVRAAQNRPLAGAEAWERKLAVDQSPLVAATLAAWAFLSWEVLSQPSTFVI